VSLLAGWWELTARLYRHRMRHTEAAAQGTFLLLLAGGLLFATAGSSAVWERNNRGVRVLPCASQLPCAQREPGCSHIQCFCALKGSLGCMRSSAPVLMRAASRHAVASRQGGGAFGLAADMLVCL
jgi:hypothetical protein